MQAIRLNKIFTRAPKGVDKDVTKKKMTAIIQQLDDLQALLYAESKHSILVVLQGMDASGKDGLIRDVFSEMNPEGVRVNAFKVPTALELSHDFLWRIHQQVPAKGMIQVFNRSYYEDVLVTRVHGICDNATAKKRMKAINDFEQLLTEHNNTHILKCYLHISPEEQQQRLQDRLQDPKKNWKYNKQDSVESKHWKAYMKVYEDCFANTNKIPWHIIPADQNWYKDFVVASELLKLMKGLQMHYPKLDKKHSG